jgi:hypothetical protein
MLLPSRLPPATLLEVILMEHMVISSEPFIQKCRSLSKAKDPYLEVVKGRIRLAWTDTSKNRIEFMERADAIGLGISYDMLVEALLDAGGSIDADGRYPINNAISHRLRMLKRGSVKSSVVSLF